MSQERRYNTRSRKSSVHPSASEDAPRESGTHESEEEPAKGHASSGSSTDSRASSPQPSTSKAAMEKDAAKKTKSIIKRKSTRPSDYPMYETESAPKKAKKPIDFTRPGQQRKYTGMSRYGHRFLLFCFASNTCEVQSGGITYSKNCCTTHVIPCKYRQEKFISYKRHAECPRCRKPGKGYSDHYLHCFFCKGCGHWRMNKSVHLPICKGRTGWTYPRSRCPVCKVDFTTHAMKKHIINKHPDSDLAIQYMAEQTERSQKKAKERTEDSDNSIDTDTDTDASDESSVPSPSISIGPVRIAIRKSSSETVEHTVESHATDQEDRASSTSPMAVGGSSPRSFSEPEVSAAQALVQLSAPVEEEANVQDEEQETMASDDTTLEGTPPPLEAGSGSETEMLSEEGGNDVLNTAMIVDDSHASDSPKRLVIDESAADLPEPEPVPEPAVQPRPDPEPQTSKATADEPAALKVEPELKLDVGEEFVPTATTAAIKVEPKTESKVSQLEQCTTETFLALAQDDAHFNVPLPSMFFAPGAQLFSKLSGVDFMAILNIEPSIIRLIIGGGRAMKKANEMMPGAQKNDMNTVLQLYYGHYIPRRCYNEIDRTLSKEGLAPQVRARRVLYATMLLLMQDVK